VISGIVGLDLSLTGTGFARWSVKDKEFDTHSFSTSPKQGTTVRRSLLIAKHVVECMMPNDVVFIEDYAFGVSPKQSQLATLGELGGVVKAIMLKFTGSEPLTITTGEMRKFVSGNGNLKKDMIPVAVLKRYKMDPPSHDECVALVLSDMGSHLVLNEPATKDLVKYQEVIIHNLRKKHLDGLKAISEKIFKRAKKT
jgi:hypothetical protein